MVLSTLKLHLIQINKRIMLDLAAQSHWTETFCLNKKDLLAEKQILA